jgi:ribosome recycling factor
MGPSSRDDVAMHDADDAALDADRRMARAVAALEHDLARIRVGAASGSLVEGLRVDHQGRRVRLLDLASVTVPDPRQIVIRPWDPGSLRAIGAAIRRSRIGLTPTVDGATIRLAVPGMTAERREELVRLVGARVEQAHVEIRTIRHDALGSIRDRQRRGELGADAAHRETARLQASTDRTIDACDRLGETRVVALRRV